MFTVCKDKVSPWGRVKKKVKNFLFPAENVFRRYYLCLAFCPIWLPQIAQIAADYFLCLAFCAWFFVHSIWLPQIARIAADVFCRWSFVLGFLSLIFEINQEDITKHKKPTKNSA